MTDTIAAPFLDRLFLGRQPILDASEALIGYELLFRNSAENVAPTVSPGLATADVVCKAFAELGLVNALAGRKVFVIADAEFLRNDAIEALPPDGVVFEVDAALAGQAEIVARCVELAQAGFAFCLMNPQVLDETTAPLLKLAMFLKLNVQALGDAQLKSLLDLPAEYKLTPIASHVETQTDHRRAQALGFQFFQGYYFAEPTLVEGRKVDPAMQALMRIISLLNRDAEIDEIEQAFKGEAALTMKLLRLTNSVGIGLRVKIGSVRQAIGVIGRRHIGRWLQLLLFSQNGEAESIECNPLMQLAALKGSFMERLARRCYPQQSALHDQAFLAGLMSLMPVALGLPMEDLLEQLTMAPALRQALLTRAGELGALLELTERYDDEDIAGVDNALSMIGHRIGRDVLNLCLAESIAWVQTLAMEAG